MRAAISRFEAIADRIRRIESSELRQSGFARLAVRAAKAGHVELAQQLISACGSTPIEAQVRCELAMAGALCGYLGASEELAVAFELSKREHLSLAESSSIHGAEFFRPLLARLADRSVRERAAYLRRWSAALARGGASSIACVIAVAALPGSEAVEHGITIFNDLMSALADLQPDSKVLGPDDLSRVRRLTREFLPKVVEVRGNGNVTFRSAIPRGSALLAGWPDPAYFDTKENRIEGWQMIWAATIEGHCRRPESQLPREEGFADVLDLAWKEENHDLCRRTIRQICLAMQPLGKAAAPLLEAVVDRSLERGRGPFFRTEVWQSVVVAAARGCSPSDFEALTTRILHGVRETMSASSGADTSFILDAAAEVVDAATGPMLARVVAESLLLLEAAKELIPYWTPFYRERLQARCAQARFKLGDHGGALELLHDSLSQADRMSGLDYRDVVQECARCLRVTDGSTQFLVLDGLLSKRLDERLVAEIVGLAVGE